MHSTSSVCRPIVFSLDDCKEYRADFVLATLLDSTTTPSQPHTSTSLAHSTTATRKVPNGHHHRAEVANHSVALREYSTMLEEDTMGDFTNVCVPPVSHRGSILEQRDIPQLMNLIGHQLPLPMPLVAAVET